MAPSSVGSTTLTAPSSPVSPTSPTSQRSGASNQSVTSRGSTAPLLNLNPHHGGGHGGGNTTHGHGPGSDSRTTFARIQEQSDGTVGGWPRLAKLMEKEPAVAAFARFHDANIKTLLYFQVEIAQIQSLLTLQEEVDHDVPAGQESPCDIPSTMVEPRPIQWVLIERLRKCVHQYNRALLEYAQVSALPDPSSNNMATLVEWMGDPRMGALAVKGLGSAVWGDQENPPKRPTLPRLFRNILCSIFLFWKDPDPPRTRKDLVVPRLQDPDDELTRWIRAEWMPFRLALCDPSEWAKLWAAIRNLCRIKKREDDQSQLPSSEKHEPPAEKKEDGKEHGIKAHSGNSIVRFTSGVVTIVASMLPTMAIAILTTADTLRDKLLYIGGFTALFAIGLMILTSETSRVQIFTATAAFSAVLVVFVQNQ